ncbi:FecR family protein [Parasphingorhabdus sp.]|uniref:FecR family protein n=1 Tax=Parasphingorhabdus sp. TaxID=2709688 RepID=UPI002F953D02
MAEINDMIREQAIAWAIRVREPDFADWDGFTQWLEADALHNIAYEEALLAEDQYADLVEALDEPSDKSGQPGQDSISHLRQPANDDHAAPVTITRRRVMSGAIAAALVAAVGAGIWTQMPQPYDVMTGPGQRKTLTLSDGSRIQMNGDTKIELDRKKIRYAHLDRGEALFTVVHDDDDPFIVDSGNIRLVDAGTEFNVVKSEDILDVAVSDGVVIYNPERENISLPAGKRLYRDGARNRVTVSDISIAQVGAWRTGQLGFTGEPLKQIAQVLSRNLGVNITVSEAIAARPFSGIIQLKDRDPQNIEPIAALLGVQAQKQAEGWILIGDNAVP